jgi:ATP-dependent DNA helicase RecG
MDLNLKLSSLPGVGPAMSKKLEKLDLIKVEDLLFHFPFRYDDFSVLKPVSETQIGEVVTLRGEIWSIKNVFTRAGKVLTQAIFNDGESSIYLTWFNQSYLIKTIATGSKLQISGKLTKYKNKLSIIAPQWEKVEDGNQTLHTGRLVPIYSETSGVTSKWLRNKIDQVLPLTLPNISDYLPGEIKGDMLDLPRAISKIHFPDNFEDVEKAKNRLGFDELLLIQLATQQARLRWQSNDLLKSWVIKKSDLDEFYKSLPFKLTEAQLKVISEINEDLQKTYPMNRLLQGEVGSGKTIVAATAIYLAHLNGYKSLLMAPTEILAWQHFETLKKLLEPFSITVSIYTGSKKSVPGDVIVGTHALLSEKIQPENVGLVVVDEQHRFGVTQRGVLRQKGVAPHFLTMTATPIPRTVALTIYADLDLSVIDELPKSRPKISTHLVPEVKRNDAYKFIEKKVREGIQAYIITPLIEESETRTTAKAATVEFENLKTVFPDLKLGLLHGRMKSADKQKILDGFRNGEVQILVSTSVVEVGVDVPNACIILIEGAERFGLAALHQLRGRVGRGIKESFCLLFTENSSDIENNRLKYMETTFNGLKLAELDLKIRGSGTIFSTHQHGRFKLQIADLTNLKLIEEAKQKARKLLQIDPTLEKYPLIRVQLSKLASDVMPD